MTLFVDSAIHLQITVQVVMQEVTLLPIVIVVMDTINIVMVHVKNVPILV